MITDNMTWYQGAKYLVHRFEFSTRSSKESLARVMHALVQHSGRVLDTYIEDPDVKRWYRLLIELPEPAIESFKSSANVRLEDPRKFTIPGRDRGDWMCLVDGEQFFPFDPKPSDFKIEHIAHCLSMLCRYSGHTNDFYSVAEHSVLCVPHAPPELRLEMLLHDGSEAYCADLPKPIKRSLPSYRKLEDNVQMQMAVQFGLVYPFPEIIHQIDTRILANEMRDILTPCVVNWTAHLVPLPDTVIQGWTPARAKAEFLDAYEQIMKTRKPK